MRARPNKPLDFSRAFKTSIKLLDAEDERRRPMTAAEQSRLEKRIKQLDDAITPPDKRGGIARRRAARARKQRLAIFLRHYVRLFGAPRNIDAFIKALGAKGWLKIAPPGPDDYPGPNKPHDLGGQTIRDMLREIGVAGVRGRKARK
jgi:hypothetical protein